MKGAGCVQVLKIRESDLIILVNIISFVSGLFRPLGGEEVSLNINPENIQ